LSRPFGFQPRTACIAPDVIASSRRRASAPIISRSTDFSHSASGLDAAEWTPRLKAFMAALQNRS
jgi:hypothetical protein